MSNKPEPVDVVIKGMKLRDVVLEGISPLDVISLAKGIENKMQEISSERTLFDSYKLALYTALYYAGIVYSRTDKNDKKDRADEKQVDNAIEKLTMAINGLPLK